MDSLGFAIIACGIVVFALVSRRLENTIITPPMLFAGFGLVLGDAVLGVAHLDVDHGFVHLLAELTLILVLFTDAARIELRRLRGDHNLPVRMLLVGMPLTIILGTGVALALPFGFSPWEAALLAAILAPTDAALGQSVVSSPAVPRRIRQTLNVESGLNDGIALPLVLLFACLAGATHAPSDVNWVAFGIKQLTFGPLAGTVIGGIGAWFLDQAAKRDWVTETYEGAAILAIAFLAYSGAELVDGNGFISAFVAGLVFGNVVRGRCGFVFEFAEAEGQLLVLITFLIFGAAILPEAFGHISWAVVVYAVLSLTLIRMLPIALSLIGTGVHPSTVAFLGWFGPRGLASILFALFILEEVTTGAEHMILAVTIVTVTMSIVAHGLSAAPLAKKYGALSARLDECAEQMPVSEFPTRAGVTAPDDAAAKPD